MVDNQSALPEVLFVDEDGNPIEAGHENIVYVDENGNEIPEEIAMQLLESGKYIDSRELYLETDSQGGYETQAQSSAPLSSFGSLSKSNTIQAELSRRASSQALYQAQLQAQAQAIAIAEAQAKVFAKVQADLKRREDEIASIEADAARVETPQVVKQVIKTSNSSRSLAGSELQILKSQSGRRLLQPPPKKKESKSTEKLFERASSAGSVLRNDEELTQQRIAELAEQQNLKEILLRKQQEILEQQRMDRLSKQTVEREMEQLHIQTPNPERIQIIDPEPDPSRYTAQSFVISQHEEVENENEPDNFNLDSSSSAALIQAELSETPYHHLNDLNITRTVSKNEVVKTPVSNENVSTQEVKEFSSNFNLGQAKFVGFLRGSKVISDVSQLDMNEIEKIYQLVQEDEKDQVEAVNSDQNSLIDPFDPKLFNDEIVDIDFGAIDAYTAALNAHLIAHKNGHEVSDNLQFPAHVLTSNHASFIDNQLLLGDPLYNTFDFSNSMGVNVQQLSPLNDPNLSQSFKNEINNNNNNNKNFFSQSNLDYDYENYSRSNSYGSLVDIQSHPAYSVRDLNQANDLNNYQTESIYYTNNDNEIRSSKVTLEPYQSVKSKQSISTNGLYSSGLYNATSR